MASGTTFGVALHIGADVLTSPDHARWPAVRSGRDSVRRLSRLCAAAGIAEQRNLLGEDASCDRVRESIVQAAAGLEPGGYLVLTFSGHSERGDRGDRDEPVMKWCLYDGTLRLLEVAGLLAAVAAHARVVVVSDTCYAAALARYVGSRPRLILLSACAENQITLLRPRSEFVARLERLVLADGTRHPDCASYTWLGQMLQKDTPDAERPGVWANHTVDLADRPFDFAETPIKETR